MALDRWAPGWNEKRAPDSLEVSQDHWVATKPRIDEDTPDPLARRFPEGRPVDTPAPAPQGSPLAVDQDPDVDARRAAWLREADEEEGSLP